jgi:hypothetical protein
MLAVQLSRARLRGKDHSMRLVLAVAVTLALVTGEALALAREPNSPKDAPVRWAVSLCVDEVRSTFSDSEFDAYLDPNTGSIGSWATEAQRSHFMKCMAMKGHAMNQPDKGVSK